MLKRVLTSRKGPLTATEAFEGLEVVRGLAGVGGGSLNMSDS